MVYFRGKRVSWGGRGLACNYTKMLEETALIWGQSKGQQGIYYFLSFSYQYSTNTSSVHAELNKIAPCSSGILGFVLLWGSVPSSLDSWVGIERFTRVVKVWWPTTVTAKELTSMQKEKPHKKKKKTHGKKNNLTAKRITSRQKGKPRGKKKKTCGEKNNLREKIT